MINYRIYLYKGPFEKGPCKEDLKLKRTMTFIGGKKIANLFNEMLGLEDICTRISHLEGKKVFDSSKKNPNFLIDFEVNLITPQG